MNYLAILKGLVALVSYVAKYFSDKRLIDAGVAQATLEGLKDVQEKMAIARDAVANVDSLPVDKDPANRKRKR